MNETSSAGTPAEKRERLKELLRRYESVLVGYSGGVDSVFLARVAVDVLGPERVLAVTGKSDSLASWMEDTARQVAERFGIPWLEVATEELADPRYAANPSNRCYFCKSELWTKLRGVAAERGLRTLVDGANSDDVGDHRPGSVAGAERGVRSPLLEAGLTKADIRAWSHELGLPTWDQPAAPCLASRIPYGLAVTPERLREVETAELALRALGLRDFRVRHHAEVARLEVHPAELDAVPPLRREIAQAVLGAGFRRVVLDLEGYRRGALNEALPSASLVQLQSAAPAPDPEPSTSRVARSTSHVARVEERGWEALGRDGEIAALAAPGPEWAELLGEEGRAVAGRLKELGFRYVALDLEPAG